MAKEKYYVVVYKTKKTYDAEKPSFKSIKTLTLDAAEKLVEKNSKAYACETYNSKTKERLSIKLNATGEIMPTSVSKSNNIGLISGTKYGYTLAEYDKKGHKNGLFKSPDEYWSSQLGVKYKDSFGRTQSVSEKDKDSEMYRYAYKIMIGVDLGSDKIPDTAKKFAQEHYRIDKGAINASNEPIATEIQKDADKTESNVSHETNDWTALFTREEMEFCMSVMSRFGGGETNLNAFGILRLKEAINKHYVNFSQLGQITADAINDKLNKFTANQSASTEKPAETAESKTADKVSEMFFGDENGSAQKYSGEFVTKLKSEGYKNIKVKFISKVGAFKVTANPPSK